jgi:putative transcriptional regulator
MFNKKEVIIMNRLKQIRTQLGLSQSDIANKLDISVQRYSLYETNNRKLPVSLAFELCKLFNLKLEDIFLDDN